MGCLGALGFLKTGVAVLGLFHSQELNKAFVGPSEETQGSGAQPGVLPDRALLHRPQRVAVTPAGKSSLAVGAHWPLSSGWNIESQCPSRKGLRAIF